MMNSQDTCTHCWHASTKPYMMVLKDGHIIQVCCKCEATRTIHQGHVFDQDRHPKFRCKAIGDRSIHSDTKDRYDEFHYHRMDDDGAPPWEAT